MVKAMSPEFEGLFEPDEATPLERLRERVATWATLALIMVFLFVTIALWGYATWWVLMKLIGLLA
ncbi:hypothetical protein FV232_27460 [Methylobacterium sp. WL30]|nr:MULTISPECIES: hypothetical protein [unclassified Methylobacterium]TXN20349.1 hypothetical protein FV225_27590 [Methylobacterium sp. WL93]TXN42950.1 hypothetical protein FV227_28410 [Methylobacterium sp. WL119]TXN61184.1 hypothetical protein FV232_27460 [Methylobacterium sp. WL30]